MTPRPVPRRLAHALAAAATALAGAAACTDVGTDPGTPVAIELDPAPLPAVMEGDSLRDTTGQVVSLTARAFNASDAVIPDAPIRFYALDTAQLAVDSLTGRAFGKRPGPNPVPIIAGVGGLQSERITLRVMPRPDTAVALDTLRRTIRYVFPTPAEPNPRSQNGRQLRVYVGHDTVLAQRDTTVPVQGVFVRYRIVEPAVSPGPDTTGTVLLTEGRRASTADTTDAGGVASRTLALPVQPPLPDSVVVEVLVLRPDRTRVPGSPIRYTLVVNRGTAAP